MEGKSDFDILNSSWDQASKDILGKSTESGGLSIGGLSGDLSSGGPGGFDSVLGTSSVLDSSLSGMGATGMTDSVLGSAGDPMASPSPGSVLSDSPLSGGMDGLLQGASLGDLGSVSGSGSILNSGGTPGGSLEKNTGVTESKSGLSGSSSSGLSLDTLGAGLLGDYGSRDYMSEFLSGSQKHDDVLSKPADSLSDSGSVLTMGDKPAEEVTASPLGVDVLKAGLPASPSTETTLNLISESTPKEAEIPQTDLVENKADDVAVPEVADSPKPAEVSSAVTDHADRDAKRAEAEALLNLLDYDPELKKFARQEWSDDEIIKNLKGLGDKPERTQRDLTPVSSHAQASPAETNSSVMYYDHSDSYDITSSSDDISLDSNWFGEYSSDSRTGSMMSSRSGRRSGDDDVDNYDYNYTGLQLSNVEFYGDQITSYKNKENIGCGMVVICFILFFFAALWGGFIVIAIVGLIVGIIIWTNSSSRAKEIYKTHFVEETLKKNIYLRMYQPNQAYGVDVNYLYLTNREWNRSKVDDIIDGLYKGIAFHFMDVALDYNSGGKNSTTQEIFRGQIYETDLKKHVAKNYKYVRRLTPCSEFTGINQYFEKFAMPSYATPTPGGYTVDEIETPAFVEAMEKFYRDVPAPGVEIRLMGKKMTVVMNSSMERFELQGNVEDSVERLNAEIKEMVRILQFLKDTGIVFEKNRVNQY